MTCIRWRSAIERLPTSISHGWTKWLPPMPRRQLPLNNSRRQLNGGQSFRKKSPIWPPFFNLLELNFSRLVKIFCLLSCRSRAKSILSTGFNEKGMAALKNSKPNVKNIRPPWKGWHWLMMSRLPQEQTQSWRKRKQSQQGKIWTKPSRTSRTQRSLRKKSLKVGSSLIMSGIRTTEMRSKSCIQIWT